MNRPRDLSDAALAFGAVRDWLASQGQTPFAFQEEVWAAYARGAAWLAGGPHGG